MQVVSCHCSLCDLLVSFPTTEVTAAPLMSTCKLQRATMTEVNVPVSSFNYTRLPIFVGEFAALKMDILLLMTKVWKTWN